MGDGGEWQSVEAVVVEDAPLEAYNLSVDEYATYYMAGDVSSDAVWVHNTCYVGRPDGFVDTGRVTDYGQPIIRGPDGREVYQGHPPNDNNWYAIDGSPPTPRLSTADADMASFRHDLGLPPAGTAADRSTIAAMQINGEKIFVINAHGQEISVVNAISRTQAEIDVLNQLDQRNIDVSGQSLTLHVDRQPCRACDKNGGIRSMVRRLGLRQLTVVGPDGPIVITP